MPKKSNKRNTKKTITKAVQSRALSFWRYATATIWRRISYGLLALFLAITLGAYGIAQWYIQKHASEPLRIGTTFVPNYARYFGLDPQETMQAMIDTGFKDLRLVSYWSDIESTQGEYDFNELDWQFELAEKHDIDISLSIGLRQPRWPECHMPTWARERQDDKSFWYPHLKDFMQATIARYGDHPQLESYQLENEFLLSVFGDCPDHDRNRLIDEFNFVKSLDSNTPVIVTRSNNATPSWPIGQPRADLNGAAVYKRVWDKTVTKRYFEYPLPAWYYAFLAGGAELTTGQQTILHELQTEPWLPEGVDLRDSTIKEQNNTMDATRLLQRMEYGVDTGMRYIDVWGVEWMYWRQVHHNDPSLMDAMEASLLLYNGKTN